MNNPFEEYKALILKEQNTTNDSEARHLRNEIDLFERIVLHAIFRQSQRLVWLREAVRRGDWVIGVDVSEPTNGHEPEIKFFGADELDGRIEYAMAKKGTENE